MAGRLDLKGCFDPEEDLGISRGYKHIHINPYSSSYQSSDQAKLFQRRICIFSKRQTRPTARTEELPHQLRKRHVTYGTREETNL